MLSRSSLQQAPKPQETRLANASCMKPSSNVLTCNALSCSAYWLEPRWGHQGGGRRGGPRVVKGEEVGGSELRGQGHELHPKGQGTQERGSGCAHVSQLMYMHSSDPGSLIASCQKQQEGHLAGGGYGLPVVAGVVVIMLLRRMEQRQRKTETGQKNESVSSHLDHIRGAEAAASGEGVCGGHGDANGHEEANRHREANRHWGRGATGHL